MSATQNGGNVTEIAPVGGSLDDPFGILVGADGRVYVGGNDSGMFARYAPGTATWQFFNVGGQPWDVVQGPDGDVYFTNRASRSCTVS